MLSRDGRRWRRGLAELLIIVVGILLALWVDRWSQERTDRASEAQYLASLATDLRSDLAQLDSAQTWTLRHGEAAHLVLAFLDGAEPRPSPADVVRSIVVAGWQYPPPLATLTLEELRSTGNLQLIQNQDLKRSIGEYYDLVELNFATTETLKDRVWDGYDRVVPRLLPAEVRLSVNEHYWPPIPTLGFDPRAVPIPDTASVRARLSTVPQLAELLSDVILASAVERGAWAEIQAAASALLSDIDDELTR